MTYTATTAMQIIPDEAVKGIDFSTQSERELFELTPWGQSIPMAPHLNAQDGTPRRFRPEIIQKRLSCSWENAFRMATALRHLEASREVAEHYIDLTRNADTGKEKLAILEEIEMLAQEVQLVTFQEDREQQIPVLCWMSEYSRKANKGAESLLRHAENLFDRLNFGLDSDQEADIDDYLTVNRCMVEDEEEMKASFVDGEFLMDTDGKEGDEYITPDRNMDVFSYGQFDDKRNDEPDWLESQPEHYRQLIDRVKHGSLDVFKATAIHREYTRKEYFDEIAKTTRKPRIFKALAMILRGTQLDVPEYDSQQFPEGSPEIARLMDDDFQGTIARHYECNPADDDAIEHWTPQDKIKGFTFNPTILAVFDFLKTKQDKEDFHNFLRLNSTVEKPMTNGKQISFFWTLRKVRKAEIQRQQDAMIERSERKQSKQILQRIAEQESLPGLKAVARNIMNFAKSDACKVPEAHWPVIWRTYHQAKQQFA